MIITGLCTLQVEAAVPIRVNAGRSASTLAVSELQSYLAKMFTNSLDVTGKGSEFDIVIGTTKSNPLVAKAVSTKKIALPSGKNADQGYSIKTVGKTIWVIGNTDQGVLYGMYELLEQYGAYFQIDGERLPAKTAFTVKQLNIRKSPVFKYRGLLPWDNFLCGMSGYDMEQYEEMIDRGTRMKFNMLQFHFYPGMAFFTETVDGETSNPTWIGGPVDVFKTKGSIGESVFKGGELFGSKPYVDNIGNPRKQADAVQAMMRKVIDYAHTRGWKTCVGFELMLAAAGNPSMTDKPDGGWNSVNPLDPRNVDISLQRYRSLVKTYPNSDFYWMWQSEGRGVLSRHIGREPGAAEMREKYKGWAKDDLAGDIDYAYLFREVANRLTPQERARLATGGWSIQHLFPNIEPDFPKELTFASLNSYHLPAAAGNQVPCFRVAKDGRRAWMIEWWEFDGNQWFPQFRVGWQENMYKQCADYGVESVTLLGWKLSGIEHNVRYLSEFSWNPKLTGADFYKGYVQRLYGKQAKPLIGMYLDYDKYEEFTPTATPSDYRPMLLSAGWMPLAIPSVPGSIEGLNEGSWKDTVVKATDVITQQQKLLDMDERSIAVLKQAVPKLDKQGQSWAKLMINRLEFRVLYLKSLMCLNQSLIDYDKAGREKGIVYAPSAAVEQAAKALELSKQAIEKYAEEVRNRGDQGVIAQMNEQYYKVLKQHFISMRGADNAYATLDWTAFRLHPKIRCDFSGESPWTARDGKTMITPEVADGTPALKLEIGGNGTKFSSVYIHRGLIDLDDSPYLDFRIRTSSAEPLAIMFQTDYDDAWYALNMIGMQRSYNHADGLPAGSISDGKWHRVTWNLRETVKDRIGAGNTRIKDVILGSWEAPAEPIVVEFSDFAFGRQNTLD